MRAEKDDTLKQYFFAIIPPPPVFDEALALKKYFQEKYNSKAALNSPPHITVHMPFTWKEKKEDEMARNMKEFVTNFDPIKVCLDNFSAFAPRVIFIKVAESEILNVFQKKLQQFCKRKLNLFNANYREEPFHPHLTLAFRDLRKHAYSEAWEEFRRREFKAEFMADKLSLLKHNGRIWEVAKEFTLESSYSTDNKSELATTEG
jgi:2'-5' RNA ligase